MKDAGMSDEPPFSSSNNNNLFKTVHLKYIVIPCLILGSFSFIIFINPNTWIVSSADHFYLEIIAVILSTIVGIYCMTRTYTLHEKFSLFLGIGFLTNAVIDLLHAILSYLAADEVAFLNYFIPQTWFAGRTFLGLMLVIAVAKYAPIVVAPKEQSSSSSSTTIKKMMNDSNYYYHFNTATYEQNSDDRSTRRFDTLLLPLLLLAALAVSVVVLSFFTINFPGIVVNNYVLHRPYEIPAIVLFSTGLFLFYKKKLYATDDIFYRGILGALILDIFGQVIMSYSAMNFHTAHTVSHILKDAAYFVIVVSLAVSSIQYNRIAGQREEMIRIQYERLKQVDKMKDEFINVAAHELRTPIQPIIGMADLLESSLKDNNQKQLLKVIGRNGKRLQKLTDAILDTTKIESGSLNLTLEQLDLNDVITNAIDDITAINYLNEIEKRVHILYRPVHIFLEADKNRLTQVITNLLDNAIKFTKDGTVSITVEKNNNYVENVDDSNNYVTVSITDTGQGIDSEILPRLFSKFASKSFSGTGLGLYISKSIIEAHGGKVWAENNKDGTKGATFAFAIPIVDKKHMYAHNHNEMKI